MTTKEQSTRFAEFDPFAGFDPRQVKQPNPDRCDCGAGLDSFVEGQSGMCTECLDKQWSKYYAG